MQGVSANNANEFDPCVPPDGRLSYGRWEYVDTTALSMQTLRTMWPDGRMEESLYGNNAAHPTAMLDARPMPDGRRLIATLTPHNGQSVGAIGVIDPALGKTNLEAIANRTPEYPKEMDQGLRVGPCDPWPLTDRDVSISNNAVGRHGVVQLIDDPGFRDLVYADERISCYAPTPPGPAALNGRGGPNRHWPGPFASPRGEAALRSGREMRERLLCS